MTATIAKPAEEIRSGDEIMIFGGVRKVVLNEYGGNGRRLLTLEGEKIPLLVAPGNMVWLVEKPAPEFTIGTVIVRTHGSLSVTYIRRRTDWAGMDAWGAVYDPSSLTDEKVAHHLENGTYRLVTGSRK